MALYLIQEPWGRMCLHLMAALRAGHWRWHLAGIGREMECIAGLRLSRTLSQNPAATERQSQHERKSPGRPRL